MSERIPTRVWQVGLPERRDGMPGHPRKEGFFVSKPLPSYLVLDQQTQQRRSRADYALGRLHEAADGLPDWNVLVRTTQHREIQSMLAFRGVTVTNREIASIDLPDQVLTLRPPYNVAKYVRVMGDAARDVHRVPIGEIVKRAARDLACLGDETAAEEDLPWRTTTRLFGTSPDDVYHLAVSPGVSLRAETERLFEWIDDATDITLVDKIAAGTFELFTLDPFTNTADLLHVLITLLLIKSGVVQDQIVPTSVHIDRNRDRFQRLHEHVVRTEDYNEWVRFFADGLVEQCENQLRVVHELARLPGKYRARVDPAKRRDGFARLLAILPSFQIVNVPLVADKCEITRKRARELLARAEALEIVAIRRRGGDSVKTAEALATVGTTMFDAGRLDAAVHYLGQADQLLQDLPDDQPRTLALHATILSGLGRVHARGGSINTARTFYHQALTLALDADEEVTQRIRDLQAALPPP